MISAGGEGVIGNPARYFFCYAIYSHISLQAPNDIFKFE
jgi:hypothetical protein